MTDWQSVTPPPKIARDRWGRPLVTPPNGGKAVAYTRCTTFVSAIEDTFNLQKWLIRQTALGLAQRSDLLLAVTAHRNDKRELDKICEQAKEAAAASAKATTGTALHSLTEALDRGQELPALPAGAQASIDAYAAATKELKAVAIESFTVLDSLQVAGTPDRVVEYGGERYIADIKTGSIDYGILKIAAQLAVYARGQLYDITTGERSTHGASTTRGVVIHVPSTDDPAEAKAELWWIDLEAGWQAVLANRQVRELRKTKFAQITSPFGHAERPSLRLEKKDQAKAEARAASTADRIRASIDASRTPDEVRAVWASWEAEWTDELTKYAGARVADLEAATTEAKTAS